MLRQWILTASVLTAAALILRLIFHKRISQRLQYALWLPVLLRLLLPFALFSAPVSVSSAAERDTRMRTRSSRVLCIPIF